MTKQVTVSPEEGQLKKEMLLEAPLVLAGKEPCLKPHVLWSPVL